MAGYERVRMSRRVEDKCADLLSVFRECGYEVVTCPLCGGKTVIQPRFCNDHQCYRCDQVFSDAEWRRKEVTHGA